MLSQFSRRLGAHVRRPLLVSVLVLALVLAAVSPALAASATSVRIRIEGTGGTVFSGVKTVAPTTITDSTGGLHDAGVSAMAALAVAARLGAFPYVIRDTVYGLSVDSVNGESFVPAPPYPGWSYRVNGVSLPFASDQATLTSGADVLWYYGAWDASPTVATLSSSIVKTGASLTVTAKQLDMDGVATPLAGAIVHIGSRTATSTANGTVTLPMSAVGDYGVRVEKDGCIRSAVSTVHVRNATSIAGPTVTRPSIKRGATSVVRGVLAAGSSKLAGRTVTLWHRAKGSAEWVAGRTATTGVLGGAAFTVRPGVSTYYRIAYSGSATFAPATSAAALVTVR